MKKILVLAGMLLIALACNNANKPAEESSTQEINVENLVEVSIPVHGMTCEGCENAIKKSVSSLEGIADVSASHIDSIAVVKYDKSATNVDAIEGKIADAGYTVAR
ncbi:cation transporter [Bacteroidota bacterium]